MKKRNLKKFHKEVDAYLAFYAAAQPQPMLAVYPRREPKNHKAVHNIKRYTTR